VFGPFFSTDAGGRTNGDLSQVRPSDGLPPTKIPGFDDFMQTAAGMNIEPVVLTPWGKLVPAQGPLGFRAAPLSARPVDNIATFDLSEVGELIRSLGITGPPQFLAVVSDEPLPVSDVERAVASTPYARWGNPLVAFNQDDQGGVPRAYFVYWLIEREPGDPSGGSGSVQNAARSLGAGAVFAQRVDAAATTRRPFPSTPVYAVVETQAPGAFPAAPKAQVPPRMEGLGQQGDGTPTPEEEEPEPEKPSIVVPALVGVSTLLLGAAIGRAATRRR